MQSSFFSVGFEEAVRWRKRQFWEFAVSADIDARNGSGSFPIVLLVDDEHVMHEVVKEALSGFCDVICVESGEEALMAADVWDPQLLILDVEMAGMDGYEACRRFRSRDVTHDTPIMFLSAHDSTEDRLRGYEAGGDDYVAKPFDLGNLREQVSELLKVRDERNALKSMADYATSTAMTAMTSLGEMGVLLESIKRFNTCVSYKEIAKATISGLGGYGLQGAVQLRFPESVLTVSANGAASPLEVSIVERLGFEDRIVQFSNRMLVAYPHVSLLVNNMPVANIELCGRLRDYLAMLAEGADARTEAVIATREAQQKGVMIELTHAGITEALREIDSAQRNSRVQTSMAVLELSEDVAHALLSLGLSESQEEHLTNLISAGVDRILSTQSDETNLQDRLSSIVSGLKGAVGDGFAREDVAWD